MNDIFQKLDTEFSQRYGTAATVHVRAPGRVNLIGEHTDYNDGFVFPMAVDNACFVAARPRDDRKVRVHTLNLNQSGEVSLDDLAFQPSKEQLWLNYIRALSDELRSLGMNVKGADLELYSTVPLGGGMSSSAAYAAALSLTLIAVSGGQEPPRPDLAQLLRRVETRATGLRCGVMDQFASLLGKHNHAILLDCRDLSYKLVPMELNGHCFVIADTCLPRTLASSKYNERRAECEAAAAALGVKSLRDASYDLLVAGEKKMQPNEFKRARHVVTEIARTQEAARVFQKGDLTAFGRLMNDSHESLKNDYEASCRELDVLVETARSIPGVLGSRLTGAGWGGCTVTLLRNEAVERFQKEVPARYEQITSRKPAIILTGAAQGAEVVA